MTDTKTLAEQLRELAAARVRASEIMSSKEGDYEVLSLGDTAEWQAAAALATIPTKPERIVAAAARVGVMTVSVPAPGRHGDVLRPLYEELRHFVADPDDQGFLTDAGRFVDRQEAYLIARAAGQIIAKTGPADVLFSEDLW